METGVKKIKMKEVKKEDIIKNIEKTEFGIKITFCKRFYDAIETKYVPLMQQSFGATFEGKILSKNQKRDGILAQFILEFVLNPNKVGIEAPGSINDQGIDVNYNGINLDIKCTSSKNIKNLFTMGFDLDTNIGQHQIDSMLQGEFYKTQAIVLTRLLHPTPEQDPILYVFGIMPAEAIVSHSKKMNAGESYIKGNGDVATTSINSYSVGLKNHLMRSRYHTQSPKEFKELAQFIFDQQKTKAA
jgi:hypothetical protein